MTHRVRKELEREPERGGLVLALALTAYACAEDVGRAFRAGCQAHVPKPVKPVELAAVAASLAGRGWRRLSLNLSNRHRRIQFNYNRPVRAFRVPTLVGRALAPSAAD